MTGQVVGIESWQYFEISDRYGKVVWCEKAALRPLRVCYLAFRSHRSYFFQEHFSISLPMILPFTGENHDLVLHTCQISCHHLHADTLLPSRDRDLHGLCRHQLKVNVFKAARSTRFAPATNLLHMSDIPQDSRRDFGTAARKEGQCQNPTLSEAANLCPARQHAAQNLFNISQHLQRRDTADNHSHLVKLLAINRPLRPINVSHLPSSKPQ